MSTTIKPNASSGKKLPKPNNMVTVPTTMDNGFFRWWCVFLRPFVNLTDREVDVVSCFLKHRWLLSKQISDPAILDSILMSSEVKRKVMEECNVTLQYFYVIMGSLRKNQVIVNNIINPRLIPNIRQDDNGCFQLLILFKDTSSQ